MRFGPRTSLAFPACSGLVGLCVLLGCSTMGGNKSPEPDPSTKLVAVSPIETVDDLSRPWGMQPMRLDAVALAVGLDGTGSDPPPSPERSMLLAEMQKHRVDSPNRVLASPATSLVLIHGWVPPGAQKGDRFDLVVQTPANSETTSLRGGWIMQAPLREFATVNNRLSSGHIIGAGEGHVLIHALLESDDDPTNHVRGRILGGGMIKITRNLKLVLREEHRSVNTSKRIGAAVNRRFHVYQNGIKQGVAIPKTDEFVELIVHPSYHGNVLRFMRVVQQIVVRDRSEDPLARLASLKSRLLRPASSAIAALQLEAMGKEGIPILEAGRTGVNPEVRFYSAEALAYLKEPAAAATLEAAIRDEPAFRWRGFAALGAMNIPAAHEALMALLEEESAETRYGAFRELRKALPNDPVVSGEVMGDSFTLHAVSTSAKPLVHIAKQERPEIVLFGPKIEIQGQCVLFAGPRILVRAERSDDVQVVRLSGGVEDETITTTRDLGEIIRAIIQLKGTYPDVVQAIVDAKKNLVLPARLAFSAVPELGRTYQRGEESIEGDPSQEAISDDHLPLAATSNPASPEPPAASVRELTDGDTPTGSATSFELSDEDPPLSGASTEALLDAAGRAKAEAAPLAGLPIDRAGQGPAAIPVMLGPAARSEATEIVPVPSSDPEEELDVDAFLDSRIDELMRAQP